MTEALVGFLGVALGALISAGVSFKTSRDSASAMAAMAAADRRAREEAEHRERRAVVYVELTYRVRQVQRGIWAHGGEIKFDFDRDEWWQTLAAAEVVASRSVRRMIGELRSRMALVELARGSARNAADRLDRNLSEDRIADSELLDANLKASTELGAFCETLIDAMQAEIAEC